MSMNGQSNGQTELLQNIWNEIKVLGQHLGRRIDETNESLGRRIDETNERIDHINESLGRRIGMVEEVLRDLGGQQLILTRYVKSVMDREIGELRDRMTRLEAQETP